VHGMAWFVYYLLYTTWHGRAIPARCSAIVVEYLGSEGRGRAGGVNNANGFTRHVLTRENYCAIVRQVNRRWANIELSLEYRRAFTVREELVRIA
jgi:hypothetical protein